PYKDDWRDWGFQPQSSEAKFPRRSRAAAGSAGSPSHLARKPKCQNPHHITLHWTFFAGNPRITA
ncbi:MAG: hypothetical protein AAF497_04525, partial [Planctomycetota bacterium]